MSRLPPHNRRSPRSSEDPARRGAFVGRAAELRRLRDALRRAGAGRGSLVLVGGEPGIGKTRLCVEFAGRAAKAGARVLWGRCDESGGAPAFWPWVQALRSGVRALEPDDLRAAIGDAAGDLVDLVPAIRERLGDVVASPPVDAAEARLRLFDAVQGFLDRSASASGLVVVLDDLHGADRSSLLLLDAVRRELARMRVLVVGTYRDTALGQEHPLRAILGEGAGTTDGLTLSGLSLSEVSRLAEQQVGRQPPPRLVAALQAKTEGNPLFVAEYLRVLAAEGRLSTHDSLVEIDTATMPLRVQTVISRRLAPLSESCRALLRKAAVIGREFPLRVLQRVDGGPGDDALAEALSAGMVAADIEPAGSYRFAHALIRETLYEALDAGERAGVHRRVGEALEQLGQTSEHLAELAYHFCCADDAPALEKGVDYARRAGAQAMGLLAFEEAVRLYQLGLIAMERRGVPAPRAECELLLALCEARKRAGDGAGAKQASLEAAAVARRGGWPELLATAALGYGSDFAEGDIPMEDPTETALLEEAIERWTGGDSALHARLLARLALALILSGSNARRTGLGMQAVEEAERLGDAGALAYALHVRRLVCWEPHRVDRRIEDGERILKLALDLGDLGLEFQARSWSAHDKLELGDAAAGAFDVAACARLAERLRQPAYRFHAALLGVGPALRAGRWRDAEVALRDACTLAPNPFILSFAQVLFEATVAFFRGGAEPIVGFFELASEQYSANRGLRAVCALFNARLGRNDQAWRHLGALENERFSGIGPMNWPLAMCNLAVASATVGDKKSAAALYDLLAPNASLCALLPVMEFYWGPVAHYLGALAATLGRWGAAERHFETALEMNRSMGAWPWVAETQCEYARMLLARGRSGDDERALGMLAQAEEAAREIDMPAMLDRARALREQSGLPPPVEGGPVFRKEGDHWMVSFADSVLRLKESKGLVYLARLVAHPGEEIRALDLADGAAGATPKGDGLRAGIARRERARSAVTKRIKTEVKRIAAVHPALGRHLMTTVSTGHVCCYDVARNPTRDR